MEKVILAHFKINSFSFYSFPYYFINYTIKVCQYIADETTTETTRYIGKCRKKHVTFLWHV